MLDAFVGGRHSFVDTADVYGDGELASETLAPWLARRRDEVVLATKVRFAVSDPGRRGPRSRPDRRARATRSLRRLRRRRHRPLPGPRARPRRARSRTPSRRSTASSAPARCARSAPRTSPRGCWPGRSRSRTARAGRRSSRCSRSTRSSSARSRPRCCPSAARPALGVLPWGPLGAGFLTGRYRRERSRRPGSRIGDAGRRPRGGADRRARPSATSAPSTRLGAVADETRGHASRRSRSRGCWPSPGVTAPILGPRTLEQLEDLLPAAELALTDEQLAAAGSLHRAAARLSRADEHRAERDRRRRACGCAGPERLQESCNEQGFWLVASTPAAPSRLPAQGR